MKRHKMIGLMLVIAFIVSILPVSGLFAAEPQIQPYSYPQTDNYPDEINAVIEIPAGSEVKYEFDSTGNIIADRYMSMPVRYPANYGSITQTKGADGDPLDVLVLTRTPLEPGALIKVRPIGILKMLDGGETDNKIIAVPASGVDSTYDEVKSIENLPAMEKERIQAFFRVYKQLPASSKIVETKGFDGVDVAKKTIKEAIDLYQKDKTAEKPQSIHPYAYPQTSNFPDEINAVIEIPAGSNVKYEFDSTGNIIADRFMSMPVQYPANYGSITQTKGGDGDPLDVLVLTRTPLESGAVIKVRPIGVLKMLDGGETDNKIIAVPASKQDSTYDEIMSVENLPAMEKERIKAFFRVYKQLPTNSKTVEIKGFDGAEAAKKTVREAISLYKSENTAVPSQWVHPYAYPQTSNYPDEINAVIEIPAGSNVKYEFDSTGNIIADRFMSMPVQYPANYGSITQTKGGDGDPLDVLVLTRTPLEPGAIIKVRPIGVLKMLDGGETDNKIIAVPASGVDSTYNEIKTVTNLPAMERERIQSFFRVYKQLPAGNKPIEIKGLDGVETAKKTVKEAVNLYKGTKPSDKTNKKAS